MAMVTPTVRESRNTPDRLIKPGPKLNHLASADENIGFQDPGQLDMPKKSLRPQSTL